MTAQSELKIERALNGVLRRYGELRAMLPAVLSTDDVRLIEHYRGSLNRMDAAEREARDIVAAVEAEREAAAADEAAGAVEPVSE